MRNKKQDTKVQMKPSGRPVTNSGKKSQPTTIPATLRRRLEGKLLSLGGCRVGWQASDPHAALIASQGQSFSQEVKIQPGALHLCHANAAELWAGTMDRYRLVTGYALSGDTWFSHSWVVDEKNLYETTHRFDRYFGVELPPLLAYKSWVENYYVQRYPDNAPPPDFWRSRPALVSLGVQVAEMPREECIRLMSAYSQGRCA